MNDIKRIPIKILDLFAGPGGLSLGLESVKHNNKQVFKLHRAVEIDKSACNTLKKKLWRR